MKRVFNLARKILVSLMVVIMCLAAMDYSFFSPEKRAEGMLLQVERHFTTEFDGFGTEWDPMFFASYNTANPNLDPEYALTEEDFELCCNRALEMGIDKFRCFWCESWIEPENDNDDPWTTDYSRIYWNSDNIVTLFKILDFCQENDIKVNLTTWGGCAYPITEHFEYAECMCIMLEECIKRGYTCVVEMTPYNEPCWGYCIDGQVDMEDYWQLCRDLHSMLKKKGLRNKIKLNLSDCNYSDDSVYTMEELGDIAEIYNTHSYDYVSAFSDTSMKDMSEILTRYAKKNGAIHLCNEYGPDTVINSMVSSDTDTYTRGLLISRIAVNFLNGGTSGMIYWCLHDQYYGDNSRMSMGLWQYKDKDWAPRPQYYAYALLTKYTQAGAKIYPIELDESHMCGIAFKNPDKSWTYIVINSSKQDETVTISNPHLRSGTMDRYTYSEDTLPTTAELIKSNGTVTIENGIVIDNVKANSMNVYNFKAK